MGEGINWVIVSRQLNFVTNTPVIMRRQPNAMAQIIIQYD